MTPGAGAGAGSWREERDRALLTLESARRREQRIEAASVLVQLALEDRSRAEELAAHVPQLMANPDDRIRRLGVALAAAVLPPDEAERFLGDRLRDPSFDVRVEATGQLADLARPSARGLLAAMLDDPSFSIRFEAARGMAALHHPSGLEVLIEALDKDHFRFRALGALAELGDARALPAVQRVYRRWFLPGFERTQAAGAMARLGDPAGAAWLLERTRKRRGLDRGLAVELLGELKGVGAKERLLEILRDPDDPARGAAARGLGRMGDADALAPLAALLQDASAEEHDRLDAAEGLLMLGVPEGVHSVEALAGKEAGTAFGRELRTLLEEYR
ncbi:MAG: HEAT repeat domain-containing protein [Myxococcaceae bacterium]|nr:HEAT repeat domain-containing protein [Myxococcaceae bacterium]